MESELISSNLASNLRQWVNEHAKQCADCTRGKLDWEALVNRLQQFEQLIELNKTVASQLDLDTLLQQIVDTATLLLKAQMGGILVFNEDDTDVQLFKVSGARAR
jgi:transcriptional regulator with GAF, ATPase, and Fis domain